MKTTRTNQILGISLLTLPVLAFAQEVEKDSILYKQIEETIIIGSRAGGRTHTESAVPIDVFDLNRTNSTLPQSNLNQILNSIAPSFTSTVQTVADGADHLDPAQLRGLGPDQTLVLVNGKRRHTSAFINVNGTPGRGTVGTDLNAIPSFAISKIEVLRDGAAAQYGSDAISGVMNLSLKRQKGFSAQLSYGGNLTPKANDHRGGFDGQLGQLDLNYGFDIGKGGFLNLTASGQFRQPTYRAGEFDGTIFNAYNAIEKRALNNGVNLSSYFQNINTISNPSDFISLIQNYAGQVDYFDANYINQIQNSTTIAELQSLLKKDVTNQELAYREQTRKDYNMRVGQSKLRGGQFFYNGELPISKDWKIYSFGGYSYRKGNAGGFYRRPDQARTFTGLFSNGFLPEITTDIHDYSFVAGLKGKIGLWDVDLSNTFGRNEFIYTIENTSNTSLRFNSPISFNAGALKFTQNTINLDFSRSLPIFEKSAISFGAEQRHEVYGIIAGEEASYATYDIFGNIQTPTTPANFKPTDFFGTGLPGGSQVFSGFLPESSLNKKRNVYAVYGEFESDFTKWLLVNAAVRYENYSDFGNTLNFKLATRAKLTQDLNFRAAASTGFRAPSIHQIYYTNIGTLYLNGQLLETGTFNNEHAITKGFGIDKLQEEKSKSLSVGLTYRLPKLGLSASVDAYFIRVDDRIILTETFRKPSVATSIAQTQLRNLFDAYNISTAQFFANAVDAETKGIDVVISHRFKRNKFSLNNDFGINLTQTRQVGDIHTPQLIKDNGLEASFFSERARIYLEEAVPRVKASLSHNAEFGKWGLYVRNTYYGKTTTPDIITLANQEQGLVFDSRGHQIITSKIVTDISASYNFTNNLGLTLGINNLFDLYPDRNVKATSNNNQFVYSRSTSQFGLNGRYIFAKLNFKF